MPFDKTFLEPEVRLGFYIPSTIKQAWAAELEVLQALDELCQKYDIKYFADWGTLLGAIRHGGFIPWDDDLDIVMLRQDYNRFMEVASELPSGYTVHTFRNQENFREFHAVVQNSEHACFEADHMRKFHGFSYIAGIDIFLLDYVYTDEEAEKDRVERIKYVLAIADALLDGGLDAHTIENGLRTIENRYNIHVDRMAPAQEKWVKLYELVEDICAEVEPSEASELTQIIPWGVKLLKDKRYRADLYNEIIRVPFEYTTMPVPAAYDEMLKRRYGDYLRLVKSGVGAHDYPFFLSQKKSLQALMDFEFPTYKYDGSVMSISEENESYTWKDIIKEAVGELGKLHESIIDSIDEHAGTQTALQNNIADAQQLSIDIGNLIEQVKGEEYITISLIEKYCECLYMLFEQLNEGLDTDADNRNLCDAYDKMNSSFESDIINHRDVVFIPFKSVHWKTMESAWQSECDTDNTDVYVMPIPYYYKDYDGSLLEEVYACEAFPSDINLVDYRSISLELLHPDVIYFQFPYDQFNATIGIAAGYHSTALKRCTDNLVYIPYMDISEFEKTDEKAYQNMDEYVTAPGVVNADSVYLINEGIRNLYVQKLTEWSGNTDTWSYWDQKCVLKSSEDVYTKSDEGICDTEKKSKTLMYYIGEGLPIQHSDTFVDKLKANIEIFGQNNGLNILLIYNQTLVNNIADLRPSLIPSFEEMMQSIDGISNIEVRVLDELMDPDIEAECDAYYGDAGPYVPIFVTNKKPVMIQNWELV